MKYVEEHPAPLEITVKADVTKNGDENITQYGTGRAHIINNGWNTMTISCYDATGRGQSSFSHNSGTYVISDLESIDLSVTTCVNKTDYWRCSTITAAFQ